MYREANVPDELRALRFKEATHFANLLISAERQRTPTHYRQPEEKAEQVAVNSRGYTRNQSIAGGKNAGLKRNRAALLKALPPLYNQLLEKGCFAFAKEVVLEATKYGVDALYLLKQSPADHASLSDADVEAEILNAFAKGGAKAVEAITFPL